jgi:hypothetical protein
MAVRPSVAVGMAVTCPPRTDPYVRNYASGSCLRYVTRSAPLGKDEQFWALVYSSRQGVRSVTTGVGYAGCFA